MVNIRRHEIIVKFGRRSNPRPVILRLTKRVSRTITEPVNPRITLAEQLGKKKKKKNTSTRPFYN